MNGKIETINFVACRLKLSLYNYLSVGLLVELSNYILYYIVFSHDHRQRVAYCWTHFMRSVHEVAEDSIFAHRHENIASSEIQGTLLPACSLFTNEL